MRNNTIDLFKLIAAFSVITLHVGFYADVSQTFGEISRLSGRWAVPFFFLVTGVFIAINKNENNCYKQALKVLIIFIVSSVVFLPFYFIDTSEPLSFISLFNVLRSGTYFHLWFLSSLAVGLVAFQLIKNLLPKLILPISTFIISLYVVCDIVDRTPDININVNIYNLIRQAISFPFISIGYLMVDKGFTRNTSVNIKDIIIAISIIGLYFLEPFVMYEITGSEVMRRQFPMFTPFVAVIILIFCFKLNVNRSVFSEAGKKYSLGIYLFHPLFILVYSELFSCMNFTNSILVVIMTFFTSWSFVFLLETKFPFLFNLLSGNLPRKNLKLSNY